MNDAITSPGGMGVGRWLALAVLIALALVAGHFGLGGLTGPRTTAVHARSEVEVGAAARDVDGVPPPPESQIEFSDTAGSPRREIAAYVSRKSAALVEAFYLESMSARGWELLEISESTSPDEAATQLTFKGGSKPLCMILISDQPNGSYVTVTCMDLGRR